MDCLTRCRSGYVLLLTLWVLAGGCRSSQPDAPPSIVFTSVPDAAEGGPDTLSTIAGRVAGARPGQRIVLFAKSDVWWVQPLASEPFTTIQADAAWRSPTHLGTEYAALLVDPGYLPPATTDALPPVGGAVAAVAIVKGKAAPRVVPGTLHFSGYDWEIRRQPSDRGGTTNTYDPANAWTDANGFLHLRIAGRPGAWTNAEVNLTRSLGYGTYLFVVRDVSHLEPSAVLSLFTWDEFAANQNHRELGLEISRWGDTGRQNAQYVIQPYYVPANVARFAAPAGRLTYSFRWEPERASFATARESGSGRSRPIAEHTFAAGVPTPGGELLRMNLYVFGSTKSPLRHGTEVVIEKFVYLP